MADDGGLRPLFRQRIKRAHWTTVETGAAQSGVPDSHVTLDHAMCWVEYKQTTGWAVTLRPLQIGWHLSCAHHGGRSLIVVRRRCEAGAKRAAADELWVLRGGCADRAREGGLRGLSQGDVVGRWEGGPPSWDWDAVRRALVDS